MYGRRHIKYAIRQPDALTGFLTQDLIEQFEDKVITILRFQHLKLADIKVSPRGICLFVEPLNNGIYRVAFGSHTCFVLKDKEKAMPHGITRDPVADLLNVIFDHLPARLIVFLLGITLHLLHICLRICRQCTRHHLQIIWGNFEICSKR